MKHNSGAAGEYAVTLSDDYLSITGTSPVFGHEQGYTEGGGIFQHGGATYVMAGYGCCFCGLGSNGFLWRSDSAAVLGNYTLLGDKVPRYANGTSVTHAQQFSVTPVYTRGGVVPMFIGVRFGSAPDYVKDHDFQCVVTRKCGRANATAQTHGGLGPPRAAANRHSLFRNPNPPGTGTRFNSTPTATCRT